MTKVVTRQELDRREFQGLRPEHRRWVLSEKYNGRWIHHAIPSHTRMSDRIREYLEAGN